MFRFRKGEHRGGAEIFTLLKRSASAHTLFREVRMGRFVKDDETAEIAWKLFEQTGSLSYYMLYKQLKK